MNVQRATPTAIRDRERSTRAVGPCLSPIDRDILEVLGVFACPDDRGRLDVVCAFAGDSGLAHKDVGPQPTAARPLIDVRPSE
jgi:hypothetical protein